MHVAATKCDRCISVRSRNADPTCVAIDVHCLFGIDTFGSSIELKRGTGNLTIVSAASITGGGSTVEVDCGMGDNTTVADVNLALVKVDALN